MKPTILISSMNTEPKNITLYNGGITLNTEMELVSSGDFSNYIDKGKLNIDMLLKDLYSGVIKIKAHTVQTANNMEKLIARAIMCDSETGGFTTGIATETKTYTPEEIESNKHHELTENIELIKGCEWYWTVY